MSLLPLFDVSLIASATRSVLEGGNAKGVVAAYPFGDLAT